MAYDRERGNQPFDPNHGDDDGGNGGIVAVVALFIVVLLMLFLFRHELGLAR